MHEAASHAALPSQPRPQETAPLMTSRADKHPLWQALSALVRSRKHGWEPAGSHSKIGPRRLAKREALLVSCGSMPWGTPITHLAGALVIGPLDLLRELHKSVAASNQHER